MEIALEIPRATPRGFAYIGHPHPLFGGTLENKVAATLARAFLAMDWIAVRPNFRGVGASAGAHDNGNGEIRDFLYLVEAVPQLPQCQARIGGSLPVALAGFSFGSHVAAGAASALAGRGRPVHSLVLVGTAAGKWPVAAVDSSALVIHGQLDETIPLTDVFAWAAGSEVPVVVIPGADHYFHRRLTVIKGLVLRNVLGVERAGSGRTDAAANGRDDASR